MEQDTALADILLVVVCVSWDSVDKVVRFGGRVQCDGDGAAWS